MELKRATYAAAIRLAMVFSIAAATLALTLDAIGDVSVGALVSIVAVTGFATSWVQTGRVQHAVASRAHQQGTSIRIPVN